MNLRDKIAKIIIKGEQNKEMAGEIADLILALPEIAKGEKMKEAAGGVAPWLSAALDDVLVCEEFKLVIRQFLEALKEEK
jgi:hypothetical protein